MYILYLYMISLPGGEAPRRRGAAAAQEAGRQGRAERHRGRLAPHDGFVGPLGRLSQGMLMPFSRLFHAFFMFLEAFLMILRMFLGS